MADRSLTWTAQIDAHLDCICHIRSDRLVTVHEVGLRWVLLCEALWLDGVEDPDVVTEALRRCVHRFGIGQELLADDLTIAITQASRQVALAWMRWHGTSYSVIHVGDHVPEGDRHGA